MSIFSIPQGDRPDWSHPCCRVLVPCAVHPFQSSWKLPDAFNSHNSTCYRWEICHQTQTHFKQPSAPFCGSTMLHIKIDPQCCTSKLIHIKHHFITHVSTRLLERSWKLTSRYLQRMRAYNPACSKNIQLYAKLFAKGSFMVRSFSVVNKSVQAARHCLAKPFPIPILSC